MSSLRRSLAMPTLVKFFACSESLSSLDNFMPTLLWYPFPPKPRGPRITKNYMNCTPLGDLDSLPLELFNEILRCSDLRAVSEFRSLDRRARVVVQASFPYKLLVLKAPNILTPLEKTGIASHFSIDDVFYALSTASCHACGEFGAYLWIRA